MTTKVKAIPDDYKAATPYLCVKGAARALDFYRKAFGATEVMRMPHSDGKIGHAEIRIGAAPIMLADEVPEMDFRSPETLGGSPVNIMIYVDDVDKLVRQAVAAGAKVTRAVENQFYGDRLGVLKDPFGHTWSFATHIEDVSPEEMRRRAQTHEGKS
jgi:PhnB protein